MNNILTTKTVFDTYKLNRGSAIHIREYIKNDTNHLIVDANTLIEEVGLYLTSFFIAINNKNILK